MAQFYHEQAAKGVRRIYTMQAVCMYLVEGSSRAVLIDTGCGETGLRPYVENLLQGKPYEVLLTHGHVDHASGAGAFEQVWLHPADWELSRQHCTLENRLAYREHCRSILGSAGVPPVETFVPAHDGPFLPLPDEKTFALGGRTLLVLSVPGHTQGSVVAFVPEEQIAFFGDACGAGTLLVGQEAATVQEYCNSLLRLKQAAPPFRRVLRQHGTFESPPAVLDENIAVCQKILSGADDAVPTQFMGLPCLRAMRIDPQTKKRLDGKEGNIVYRKDKLR